MLRRLMLAGNAGTPTSTYYDLLAAYGATHLWKMGSPFAGAGGLDSIGGYDLSNGATAPTVGPALNSANTGCFNFSNTNLSRSAPSDMYVSTPFSIQFWGGWTDGDNKVLMEINANSGFSIQINDGAGFPTIGIQISVGGSSGYTKTNIHLNDGVARHFVFVCAGASSKIYINGSDATYYASGLTPNYGAQPLYFGSRAGLAPIIGEFSDFSYFPLGLTAAQALALYTASA